MRIFRIKQQRHNGKFIIQELVSFLFFFSLWMNCFCGSHSDLPDEFESFDAAEKKLEWLAEQIGSLPRGPGAPKEYVIYENGKLDSWDTSKAMGIY